MKILVTNKLSQHKMEDRNGQLICKDAIIARTGKQQYRASEVWLDSTDDSIIDVDRTEDEVFSDATMASFENVPITIEHPNESVNPSNYKEYSVGYARDIRKSYEDGQPVMIANLVITDAQTIQDIKDGIRTELSCGYDCDIVDRVNPRQTNIRGNHIALCEHGRAGIARIVDSVVDDVWYEEGFSSDKGEYVLVVSDIVAKQLKRRFGGEISKQNVFGTYQWYWSTRDNQLYEKVKRLSSPFKDSEPVKLVGFDLGKTKDVSESDIRVFKSAGVKVYTYEGRKIAVGSKSTITNICHKLSYYQDFINNGFLSETYRKEVIANGIKDSKMKDVEPITEKSISDRQTNIVYHGTKSEEQRQNILRQGFNTPEVYCSDRVYDAEGYGQFIVEVNISTLNIKELTDEDDIYSRPERLCSKYSQYDGVSYNYGGGRGTNYQIWNVAKLNAAKSKFKAKDSAITDSRIHDFEPFFFKNDYDYWNSEANYVGEHLNVEEYIDKHTSYDDFVNEEYSCRVLGSWGNSREMSELKKYFEQKWPNKAKLAKRIFGDSTIKDARRIEYEDDIIKVTLNGKVVYKGIAEDWIDDIENNFKWTGSQYEASNDKGKWIATVLDSSILDSTNDAVDVNNVDTKNYVLNALGFMFARDKSESTLLTKAYCSVDDGKTWVPAYLDKKYDKTEGSRTQVGKHIFRPRSPRTSIGRNVLTWCAANSVHQLGRNEEIDHVNGDYTDDRLSNLEKVTHSENIKRMRAFYALNHDSVNDANRKLEHIIEYFNAWGYPSRSELQEVVKFYKMSKSDVQTVFGKKYDKSDLDKLNCYDSTNDAGTRVKELSSGYAIVMRRYWDMYKTNSFVERICHDKDEALYVKNSLQRNDGISFIVIDCNGSKYSITKDSKSETVSTSSSMKAIKLINTIKQLKR